MKNIVKNIKRYWFFFILLALNTLLLFTHKEMGSKAFTITFANTLELLTIVPPIFIMLGLLDVWVERETMVKYLGKNTGLRGGVIAFILGSAAAGPLYAAFPIAGVFLKKGASLFNVFIFIGAWSSTRLPLIFFETASMGFTFTAIRLALNITCTILIAFILSKGAAGMPVMTQHDE